MSNNGQAQAIIVSLQPFLSELKQRIFGFIMTQMNQMKLEHHPNICD